MDMPAYFRHAHPSPIGNVIIAGINIPVRIGKATVMPGDLVFGDREGVYFIPPALVRPVVDNADTTHIHDEWTRMKFAEGKYKSREIYGTPTDPALKKEYEEYLKKRLEEAQKNVQIGPAHATRRCGAVGTTRRGGCGFVAGLLLLHDAPRAQPAGTGAIAFMSTRHDPAADPWTASEIYLMDGDGTRVRRVTANSWGDGFPSLSPDGRMIVFDSNRLRTAGEPRTRRTCS
jgi:hypothetical protein